MASQLDEIVEVILYRGSTPIETASFTIPLILSEHTVFAERTRVYNSMDAVAADFDSTDEAYQIAQALYGQTGILGAPISTIVIGRKDAVGETWTEAYDAVKADNSTFYAVFIDSHDPVVVEEMSDAVATDRRIFGTSTQAAGVTSSASTTDIASILSAKNAVRSYGVYSATADVDYPEAAWAGSQLAVTPGANDWDYKRANNITRTALTDKEIAVLREKNTNFFSRVAGVDVFRDGNMFDGNPIDLIISEDWLVARLQEGVYFRMINSLKIPMTNVGLTIIENEIRAVLSLAEANGMIDRGWSVTTPDVSSIPEILRAQRIAGVFRFDARLQGAVRQVKSITGYLTV